MVTALRAALSALAIARAAIADLDAYLDDASSIDTRTEALIREEHGCPDGRPYRL